MRFMRGKKKKRKRKIPPKYNYVESDYGDIKKLLRIAHSGKLDEEGRSLIAIRIAMLKANTVFWKEARELMEKLRGNWGFVLKSDVINAINGRMIGTGDNGEDEYVLIEMVTRIGDIVDAKTQKRLLREFYDRHEKAVSQVVDSSEIIPTTASVESQPSIQ